MIVDKACYERGCACHDSWDKNGVEVTAVEQPEQEPFGYLYEGIESHTRGKTVFRKTPEQRLETRWWREVGPVYTIPPQRTWVGLTDKEIEDCYGGTIDDFAKAIEARLKEKNA